VALALSLRRPRRRRQVVVMGALVAMSLATWILTDFVWATRPERRHAQLRVVLWNAGRPAAKDASFIPMLRATDAQILFLVESGGHDLARRRFWESHFPGYHVTLMAGQITLLSRYPVAHVRSSIVDRKTMIAEYDLVLPGGTLSVVGVDVASSQCSRRRIALDRIHTVAESKPKPVLVLGDFNTPHTSILFRGLRRSFRHAFEESGRGLITTWPSLLPALALDHMWLSEGLTSVRTSVQRTWHSDHALVMADISVETLGTPPQSVASRNR
jgi:endonuclease/exonuclease/phosphatase (EEP) superfamily protein YafD